MDKSKPNQRRLREYTITCNSETQLFDKCEKMLNSLKGIRELQTARLNEMGIKGIPIGNYGFALHLDELKEKLKDGEKVIDLVNKITGNELKMLFDELGITETDKQ